MLVLLGALLAAHVKGLLFLLLMLPHGADVGNAERPTDTISAAVASIARLHQASCTVWLTNLDLVRCSPHTRKLLKPIHQSHISSVVLGVCPRRSCILSLHDPILS